MSGGGRLSDRIAVAAPMDPGQRRPLPMRPRLRGRHISSGMRGCVSAPAHGARQVRGPPAAPTSARGPPARNAGPTGGF